MGSTLRRTVLAVLVTVPFGGPAFAADPAGLWLTETGSSRVKITPCGGGYCGTIVSAPGKALDAKNPDPALRNRSVVGVQILNAQQADGSSFTGSLYNPNDGKTYSGSLRLTGPNALEVSGCVMSVFCKRQTWTRVN
ncbi:DUF2147 domain-containing protein [Methylobacterium brachiatum]|jgi:uncharacterized protein (DUF2147 family)|uniref:Uncharacterized protein (DUF2147 family) n=1 Tax=Methylobacterium brachiatum TaxID=269660 RepID=A0AAJ1WV83_9HYPH|nr:DUF2147 domain-containing protein [Methylobacterium brachiatum]MCB4803528.1 DUF2147 domain-containing protein [Methylobacterium brachiatum]MDH2311472.1 DUF2147 domain-containing protein [Methylobacterium brachiatum]MDQ0541965.1 uncharacterized protein (DUF2147 family) [Methylobacterium brachiatum]SFI85968.1 hypothetical protein SAMN02799642_02940 [Methylobacterium brachiatum]